jgi:hypothetical protein
VDLVGWILVVGGVVALLVAGASAVALLVKAIRGTAAGLTDPGVGRSWRSWSSASRPAR